MKDKKPDAPLGRDATYTRLLEINGEAFGAQEYELAYHALAAAFHRAFALGDEELLVQVSQTASEQSERLTLPPSTVPLASELAVVEGTLTRLYGSLAQMAQARVQTLRQRPTERGSTSGFADP